jgi:competence protein ComGB
LSDLLAVGFSLRESLNFIKIVIPTKKRQISKMVQLLEKGGAFSDAIKPFLKEDIYYQILIAEKHGELAESLKTLGSYLDTKHDHQSKLLQLLEYPILLLLFLGMLMVGMKIYIFPELNMWNTATRVHVIKNSTVIILLIMVGIITLVFLMAKKFWQQPVVQRVEVICRIPIVGKVYQSYCHYYLSLNLAMLLKSGLGIKSICNMLENFSKTSLLHQIGKALEKQLLEGEQTRLFINRYPFIPQELNVMLNKGNTTEALGKELVMFSKIKYQKLTKQIERLIGLIQPMMFLLIGVVIVFMYLSLLLPMYHSMEGVYK